MNRHDFAADRAQLRTMRPLSSSVLVMVSAALALCAGAACAQTASEAPVSTAGSSAGGAPTTTDIGPATVRETPPPPQVQPLPDFNELEAAADQGRKAPLLGDYHGEVGGVVGTNGVRGAFGHIVAHPTDNLAIDLRFSTLHQNGGLYDGYVYGPGARYRPGLDVMAPDPLIAPGH